MTLTSLGVRTFLANLHEDVESEKINSKIGQGRPQKQTKKQRNKHTNKKQLFRLAGSGGKCLSKYAFKKNV